MPTNSSSTDRSPRWHAQPVDESLKTLSVSAGAGLSREEAERRLEQHGRNSLPPPKRRGPWVRFVMQFHNPLIFFKALLRTRRNCFGYLSLHYCHCWD